MKYLKPTILFFTALSLFIVAKNADAAVIHRAPNNLGLVGYWSFNDATSTKATDFSGNKNTGTLTGADGLPRWTGGKLGSALSFDGVDDYVDILGTPALDNLTIALWVKPGSVTSDIYISDFGGKDEFALICGYQDGYYNVFGATYPTGDSANSQIPMSGAGMWDYVVWTKNGTNIKGYVNGVEKTSVTITTGGDFTPSANFEIGRAYGEAVNRFAGLIDDVRIYNRALSPSEITRLYQSGLTQINPSAQNKKLTSGLVGLWSFNGQDMDWAQTSAEARDRSPVGTNHGDVIGARAVRGQVGQALKFDGVDDYVDMGDVLEEYSAITISCWVYSSVEFINGGIQSFCDKFWDGDYRGYKLDYNSVNDKFHFALATNTNNNNNGEVYSTFTPVKNTWYHLVGTWDSATGVTILYINGVQNNTGAIAGDTVLTNSTPLHIGNSYYAGSNDFYFNGFIDEVRVYNRALSANEITQLYKMGAAKLTPDKSLVNVMKDSSLVGHWTFNGQDVGAGEVAYDSAANSGNLSGLTSASWGHTTTGSNRYLIVGLSGWDVSDSLTNVAVSYNGQPLSKLGGQQVAGINNAVLWGLALEGVVAAGTYDIDVTNIPSGFDELAGGSVSFTGVDQINPTGTLQTDSEKTIDISMVTGDMGVDILYIGDYNSPFTDPVPAGSGIKRVEVQYGSDQKWAEMQTITGNGTVTMAWTSDENDSAIAAIPLKAAVNTAYDRSGQSPANNGVIYGAKPSRGHSGQALSFDGVDDYVQTDNFNIGNTNVTISGWLKTGVTGTSQYFINQQVGSGQKWSLSVGSTDKIGLYTDATGWITGNNAVPINQWFHFALVGTPSNTSIYLNGTLDKGDGAGGYDISSNNIPLFIGYNSNYGYYFSGLIDEVRIYNRALSPSEVRQLYRAEGGR